MDNSQETTENTEGLRVFENRIALLENEADALQNQIRTLRADYNRLSEMDRLRQENETMKQAILRYAVACGGVDLQVVLLRARGDGVATMENFQRVTEERTDASNALRVLAREIQTADE